MVRRVTKSVALFPRTSNAGAAIAMPASANSSTNAIASRDHGPNRVVEMPLSVLPKPDAPLPNCEGEGSPPALGAVRGWGPG